MLALKTACFSAFMETWNRFVDSYLAIDEHDLQSGEGDLDLRVGETKNFVGRHLDCVCD